MSPRSIRDSEVTWVIVIDDRGETARGTVVLVEETRVRARLRYRGIESVTRSPIEPIARSPEYRTSVEARAWCERTIALRAAQALRVPDVPDPIYSANLF